MSTNTDMCSTSGDLDVKINSPRRCLPNIPLTVEPILFAIFFGAAFTETVVTNILETKICMLKLNYSIENCSGTLNPKVEDIIQPEVAKIIMAKSVIESCIPACLSFFIGPWSDTNGRKPFLLLPVAAHILYHLMWAVTVNFTDSISPLFFLFASIPLALSGGGVALFMGVFSYIGDITNSTNRGMRITVVQCCLMIGLMLGYLLIPKIYSVGGKYGTITAFLIAGGVCLVTFLYVLLFLPETVNTQQMQKKHFFDLGHVKDVFRTIVLVNRPNHGRIVIFLLVAICSFCIIIFQGEIAVRYLSLREKFSWTLTDYSHFAVLCSTISIIASLGGMWLIKKMTRIQDVYILLIVLTLNIMSSILVAFSRSSLWFIIFLNFSCFGILVTSIVRSELSKLVDKTELGKAYGFLSSIEALTPLSASPAYTMFYSAFVSSMPFAIYFLSSAVWTICLILTLTIIGLRYFVGEPYYTSLANEGFGENSLDSEDNSRIPTEINS